ncbi:MAG: ribonuclease III [Bacteroides sp.]|nr:ribonuclease III [Bacteroides sp.]
MNERRFYFQLIRMLGFLPLKVSIYKLAFLPKSALVNHPQAASINNERLEYLGDAVLSTIVADYLFLKFPNCDEGFLTKVRARIVKRKNLDYLASQIDIPSMIRHGVLPGNKSKHIYGNMLEALVGAIYLDRGYKVARKFFLKRILERHIDLNLLVNKDPDYKSRVIEWAQKYKIEVVFESLEEHSSGQKFPSFISTISLNSKKKGTGRGSTKKAAEQRAAREAMNSIQNDDN